MPQTIIPNLWFDHQSEEAAQFYCSLFPNSQITNKLLYSEAGREQHGQEPGSVMTVEFQLGDYRFVAINGGPIFKLNPSISLFVRCQDESEVDQLHSKLMAGGKELMPLQKYDFSEKYAWVEDRYGLSWQLFLGDAPDQQKITPCLMFVHKNNGKAKEAMQFYTQLIPNSKIGEISRYQESEKPNTPGTIKHASFWLNGEEFKCMDSAYDHQFDFNEAFSLQLDCQDQDQLDHYWQALSAHPASEQCGWLKDKYGLSWQVVPKEMSKMLLNPDKEKVNRALAAMFEMKKIDLAKLKAAFEGKN